MKKLFHLNRVVYASLLVAMGSLMVAGCGGSENSSSGSSSEIVSDSDAVMPDPEIFAPEARIEKLNCEKIEYDKNIERYSITAHAVLKDCKGSPQITYKLVHNLDESNSQSSNDGKFVGLKPLKSGEYYTLMAECGTLCPVQTSITSEEMPVILKMERPTPKEIEAKLNDASTPLQGNSEIISPDCKYVFLNVEGSPNVDSLTDLYEHIIFDWSSVTVTELGYDEFNRVNKIVIKINN